MPWPHRASFAVGFAALFIPITAVAQPSPRSASDEAAADELFADAVALRTRGLWKRACAAFGASHAIAPARATLLRVAECHERFGNTASAWAAYGELAEVSKTAGDGEHLAIARDKLRELELRLPRLVLRLAPGAEVGGLEVRVNGSLVDATHGGSSRPVDAGTHVVEATAPEARPWVRRVTVAERESLEVVIPRLVDRGDPALDGGASDALLATAVRPRQDSASAVELLAENGFATADFRTMTAGATYLIRVGAKCVREVSGVELQLGGDVAALWVGYAEGNYGVPVVEAGAIGVRTYTVRAGARVRLGAGVAAFANAGGGIVQYSGLHMANPLIAGGSGRSRQLASQAVVAFGADYPLTSSLLIKGTVSLVRAAVPDSFRADIDRMALRSMSVGLGYRL